MTNTQAAPFSTLTSTFNPALYGSVSTQLSVSMSLLSTDVGLIVLDVTSFSLDNGGSGIQCSSAVVNLSCSYANGEVRIIPDSPIFNLSSLTFSIDALLLTPNQPSIATIPVSSYDSTKVYLMQSSAPGGLTFQSNCDEECATCPDGQPSICLTCYQNPAISIFTFLYSDFCYEQCPDHTFLNSSVTVEKVCSDCSDECLSC